MTKTVVITGCSSGFGNQATVRLAQKGHRVYATMRACEGKNSGVANELKQVAAAEGIDIRVLDLDVSSTISVDAAAAIVRSESGAADIVINNAGQLFLGITEAFTADEFADQLDVNVVGIHRVNRAFLPDMRKRGSGLIINLSSIAGRIGLPFNSLYHASKWAVEGYSLALRGELACCGIDVVVLEPGPFTTALFPTCRLPEDTDGRAKTYPDAANEAFAGMGRAFEGLLSDPETPTDPNLVVDSIVELTDMPTGTRPFRSVVGVDMGVRERNAAVEQYDNSILEALGLKSFATLGATGN